MAGTTSGANALTFSFSTQNLRVILRDGEPWFVAADVCEALAHSNSRVAVDRLDDDEKGVHTMDTPGGAQEMTIINESGLYSLILTSRKPEAKKFKKWVTSEVLPAIRKTGRYVAPAAQAYEALTGGQLQAIRRVLWFITRGFHFDRVWVQAIYFYLRRVLNLPSPQQFHVGHVPALQVELTRILAISQAVQDITRHVEGEAARRIFRRGEVASVVLAELQEHAQKALSELQADRLTVPGWLQGDINEIAEAKLRPWSGVSYNDPEDPSFFKTRTNAPA